MSPELRRALAFIAGRRVGQKRSASSVYDYAYPGYTFITGSVGDSVSVFDQSRRSHITGSGNALYDHATGAHIQLSVNGKSFSGYDHTSRQHFLGSVSQGNVSFYDYAEAKYFHYLLV